MRLYRRRVPISIIAGHDIIVIGSSAGGIKALGAIVGKLAQYQCRDFHRPASRSKQPQDPRILEELSALSVSHPVDGDEFKTSSIYVAQPDYHLLIERDRVRIVRGPQDNRSRPAIDRCVGQAHRLVKRKRK